MHTHVPVKRLPKQIPPSRIYKWVSGSVQKPEVNLVYLQLSLGRRYSCSLSCNHVMSGALKGRKRNAYWYKPVSQIRYSTLEKLTSKRHYGGTNICTKKPVRLYDKGQCVVNEICERRAHIHVGLNLCKVRKVSRAYEYEMCVEW
jgi:hypothetical protein